MSDAVPDDASLVELCGIGELVDVLFDERLKSTVIALVRRYRLQTLFQVACQLQNRLAARTCRVGLRHAQNSSICLFPGFPGYFPLDCGGANLFPQLLPSSLVAIFVLLGVDGNESENFIGYFEKFLPIWKVVTGLSNDYSEVLCREAQFGVVETTSFFFGNLVLHALPVFRRRVFLIHLGLGEINEWKTRLDCGREGPHETLSAGNRSPKSLDRQGVGGVDGGPWQPEEPYGRARRTAAVPPLWKTASGKRIPPLLICDS